MSGRRFFRKIRQLSGLEARIIWKQLPFESKNHWENEAKGVFEDHSNVQGTAIFGPVKGGLSYLHRNLINA